MKRFVAVVVLSLIVGSFVAGMASGAETRVATNKLAGYQNITPDDVLSYKNGRYHLDGKPFAEIGFNYFDLFWGLFDSVREGKALDETNPSYVEKEQTLKELHGMGFRTIRVFGHPAFQAHLKEMYNDPTQCQKYYEVIDTAISLAEKYDLGIVWCLGVGYFDDRYVDRDGWHNDGEDMRELLSNPNSKNRQFLNRYLEDIIPRYRDRRGIVMWELANEMTNLVDLPQNPRAPTFDQLAKFADDVSRKIKELDPMRMVNSGGSLLRNQAWGLAKNRKWTRLDTAAENREMYERFYRDSGCDVMDIHYYWLWGLEVFKDDTHTEKTRLTLADYQKMADAMGKPLMIGEIGALPDCKGSVYIAQKMRATAEEVLGREYFERIESPNSKFYVQKILDEIIDADIQLAYYWSCRTEHRTQRGYQDLTPERTPVALKQVVDANRRLQKKWGVVPKK